MQCGLKKKSKLTFAETISVVKKRLAEEGFQIITENNVRAILKDTLDIEFESYVLLGIFNPSLSHRVLLSQKDAGVFLPLQIAIYEEFGHIWICSESANDSMGAATNPLLAQIAGEMDILIGRAINRI